MKSGYVMVILLTLIAFAGFSILILSDLMENIRNVAVQNNIQLGLEIASKNCLEFGIATVKLGMDNLCMLRTDIFRFNEHGESVKRELTNVPWSSKTQEFILNFVDSNSATVIFSTDQNLHQKALKESDFEQLGLLDVYNQFKSVVNMSNFEKLFCAVYRLRTGGRYLILAKVTKDGKTCSQIALVTSERLNKYVYYSEFEPEIYFTSREVVYGPLKSNSYIHTYQYSSRSSKPTFLGTVEVRGVKHFDEQTRRLTIFDSSNSRGVTEALDLRGNPQIKFVDSDVSFSNLYVDYNNAISRLVIPLSDFVRRNFTSVSSPVGILLPSASILESKIVDNTNILKITVGSEVYELSWRLGNLPDATLTYTQDGRVIQKSVKFNGVIVSDFDITLEDSESSLQNKLFLYEGNLTIFSRSNILINTRVMSKKIYDYLSERNAIYSALSIQDARQLINLSANEETSSLDLVAFSNVFIKSNGADNDRINNQKLVVNIYAFGGSFGVQNYNLGRDNGQLFVFGSIMQKVRAPVGVVGAGMPGYSKFYVHDPRALTGKMGSIATPARKQSIMVLYSESSMTSQINRR